MGDLTVAQRAALDVAIEDLDAAAQPTKAEVFTACGVHAADLRDAIKAALAPRSTVRATGEWVLVPREPTGAMIDAPRRIILDDRMRANNGRTKAGLAIDIYRAMLAAAAHHHPDHPRVVRTQGDPPVTRPPQPCLIVAELLRPASYEDLPGKVVVRLPGGTTVFLDPAKVITGADVVLGVAGSIVRVDTINLTTGGQVIPIATRRLDGTVVIAEAGLGLEPIIDRCFGEVAVEIEAPADSDTERCLACRVAFKEGDEYLPDASGDLIHFACCGPEPESFVNLETGEQLAGPPTPLIWSAL